MKIAIHWFRRDLRLEDNTALWHALQGDLPVLCVFIFDTHILDALVKRSDRRLVFIDQQLRLIDEQLRAKGSSLLVKCGTPVGVWHELLQAYDIGAVYANRDYEPYAQERDREIYGLLLANNIVFKGYKDHVIFEKNEVVKNDGTPYTVFTPYSKRWRETYLLQRPSLCGNAASSDNFYTVSAFSLPTLAAIGFESIPIEVSPAKFPMEIIHRYAADRDYPAKQQTTQLGVHFRFGTLSIRHAAAIAEQYSAVWLNELIWRDFYHAILYHFPHSATQSFKPAYDAIVWLNGANDFAAWCEGKTGYPIVDAGMRQLNATGFMHNRVRMIVASFLTKHLLIDWRWGEAYFAQQLLDYDMAANVGGWQWAASSGCDAAPYFRVFNPSLQAQKFDPQQEYIRQWVREWNTPSYPKPIVEHAMARQRAIDAYQLALK